MYIAYTDNQGKQKFNTIEEAINWICQACANGAKITQLTRIKQ